MKIFTKFIIVMFLFTANLAAAQELSNDSNAISNSQKSSHMMGSMGHWNEEKSPGIAALLSLQPMPVAFGNFYADDWEKGILYTSLELGLFIPGMMLLGDRHMGHSHMGGHYFDHSHDDETEHKWTDNDRTLFYSLLAGYVAVKIISAFDAGHSVERYLRNQKEVSMNVVPGFDGLAIKASVSF
ncbi:hypothetical protein ACFL2X_00605 [Candidatus Latescibacterota bacterium]